MFHFYHLYQHFTHINTNTTYHDLLNANKDVGLEVNMQKTKHIFIVHHQNGQNHNIKITNKTFKTVANFKYLEMSVTN
jgi:hypothetical protein